MPNPDLCTDEEIARMVHAFYADVRRDPQLGPVFNAHVDDWPEHLDRLVDFWSSILRGSGRFSGSPMVKHAKLPDLSSELFHRWLALFRATTAAQANQAMGHQAYEAAQRIARSLWYGYQISRQPDVPAADLLSS